jgi:hypothetical protein
VPQETADALHCESKTTNNGDFELGVRFSHSRSRPVSWFLPCELVKANQRHSTAPRSHAKALRGETHAVEVTT